MSLNMNSQKREGNDNLSTIKLPRLGISTGGVYLPYQQWKAAMILYLQGMGINDRDFLVRVDKWKEINALLEGEEIAKEQAGEALILQGLGRASSAVASSNSSASVKVELTEAELKQKEQIKTATERMRRIRKAYTIIQSSLDEELVKYITGVQIGYAYDLWLWLEKKFQDAEVDSIALRLRAFYLMKMNEEESFEAWKVRIDTAKKGLEYLKEPVSQNAYISKLLYDCHPRYEQARSILTLSLVAQKKADSKATYDWNYVVEFMRGQELTMQQQAETDSSSGPSLAMAARSSSSSSASSSKGNKFSKGRDKPAEWSRPGSTPGNCFECNKPGHYRHKCPILIARKKKEAQGEGIQPGSGSDEENSEGRQRYGRRSEQAKAAVKCSNKFDAISSDDDDSEDADEKCSKKPHAATGRGMVCVAVQVANAAVTPEHKDDESQPFRQASRPNAAVSSAAAVPANSRQSNRIVPRPVPSPVASPAAASSSSVAAANSSPPAEPKSNPGTKVKNTFMSTSTKSLDEALATTAWGIDTMASVHCSGNEKMLHGVTKCPPVSIKVADGQIITCTKKGSVKLRVLSETKEGPVGFTIKDVYYHERFTTNLLSWGMLKSLDWEMHSNKNSTYVMTPGKNKVHLSTKGKVCVMHNDHTERAYAMHELACSGILSKITKAKHLVTLHNVLGHPSFERVVKILDAKKTDGMGKCEISAEAMKKAKEKIRNCTVCLQGKGARTPTGHRGLDHGTKPGEVIHMDSFHVALHDKTQGSPSVEYGLIAVEPYSEHRWSFASGRKSDMIPIVIQIIESARTMTGNKVKRVYTDGGTEFKNDTVRTYLAKNGITHHVSPPGEPKLNGIAEASVQTSKDAVRTMLIGCGLSDAHWVAALNHHTFLWNRTRIAKATGITPYEALRGKKPSIERLGVFGCDAFAFRPKSQRESTFSPKMEPCIYLGHSTEFNCPNVIFVDGQKTYATKNVEFRPDCFVHAAWRESGRGKEFIERGCYQPADISAEEPTEESALPLTEDESILDEASVDQDEAVGSETGYTGHKTYEVEAVIGKRTKASRLEYHVKWKGYPASDNSWEPAAGLAGASDAVAKFEEEVKIQASMAIDSRMKSLRSSKEQALSATVKAADNADSDDEEVPWAALAFGAARRV